MSDLNIQAEIEAMTNLISQEGSDDEKMHAILDFNTKAFKEMGFTYTLNAIKSAPDGVKFAGGGHHIEDDDVPTDLLMLLSLTRRAFNHFVNDYDSDECKDIIEDLQQMLTSRMKSDIKEMKKQLLSKLKGEGGSDEDFKAMLRSLLDE